MRHMPSALRSPFSETGRINNSDIDLCEYRGKTIINYSWGNLGEVHCAVAEAMRIEAVWAS